MNPRLFARREIKVGRCDHKKDEENQDENPEGDSNRSINSTSHVQEIKKNCD